MQNILANGLKSVSKESADLGKLICYPTSENRQHDERREGIKIVGVLEDNKSEDMTRGRRWMTEDNRMKGKDGEAFCCNRREGHRQVGDGR